MTDTTLPEKLVDSRELERIFGLDPRQTEHYRTHHGLPCYKIGVRYHYRISEVEKYLQEHHQGERTEAGPEFKDPVGEMLREGRY